jgi:hypothetical protein
VRAQYAASDHPEVLAAAERNQAGRREAMRRCGEWSTAQGGSDAGELGVFYPSSFMGTMGVQALPFEGEPPKGWVRAGHGWRPRKNSQAWRDMRALAWAPEKVPGLPDHFCAPRGENGETWLLWAVPFVWRGSAWVLLGHMPNEGEFGPEWHEVRASEAHAAREQYLDAAEQKEAGSHG